MKSYKINFEVDKNTITKYNTYGIDFDKVNGSNGINLAVPATYIVGKNGKIKYIFFNVDLKKSFCKRHSRPFIKIEIM